LIRRLMFLSLVTSSLALACGAILDLPEPTVVDGFSSDGAPIPVDGTTNDGTYADGFVPPTDGPPMNDGGSNDVVTGPPCGSSKLGCFGGACLADVCQPVQVYSSLTDGWLLDNDGTKIYFASGTSTIGAIDPNKVDAGVATLTGSESHLQDMHVSGGFVYFTNNYASGSSMNGASRCATSGCGTRTDYFTGSSHSPYGIGTDGTNVYIAYYAGGPGIYRGPIATPGPTLYYGTGVTNPSLLAVDSTYVYWLQNAASDGVFSCKTSGSFSPATGSGMAIVDMTLAGTYVYYVDGADVYRQVQGGSGTIHIAAAAGSLAVRVDGSHIYWLSNPGGAGSLYRCALTDDCSTSSAKIQTLASSLQDALALTLTSDSAYFTTFVDHTLWRVAK
jgi:hypothetical protein